MTNVMKIYDQSDFPTLKVSDLRNISEFLVELCIK